MLFNTESALASVDWLTDFFAKTNNRNVEFNPNQPLNHLQNIALHGAALSRYFWPARSGHEGRAKELCIAFAVDDSSPLKSRDLRNAMEHFDENMDDYLSPGIIGNILPCYIGPQPKDIQSPRHYFKAYYTDIGVFDVLGKRFTIEPMINEIIRIHNLLIQFQESGLRFTKT